MHVSHARHRGLGLALLSACAFGGSGVTAKPLIEAGFEPLQVVWLRIAGAALILLPVAIRHRTLPLRRPGLLVGFGLLGIVGSQALYFVAISRMPVGVAILVEYLGPALLLGWVRFVQRRPVTRAAAVGVVLAVGGMALVVEIWSGLAFDALGLLCAFCAACCQVAYFVLADQGTQLGDAPDPVAVIAHGLVIGTITLTVFAHPWNLPFAELAHHASLGQHRVPAFLLLAWLVLVATVISYLSGVIAVRQLTPQIAGVVACVEAVIATVLAWVLLGEHLGPAQVLGGALVLCGAFVAQTAAAGRKATGEPALVSASSLAAGEAEPPGTATGDRTAVLP